MNERTKQNGLMDGSITIPKVYERLFRNNVSVGRFVGGGGRVECGLLEAVMLSKTVGVLGGG